MPAHGGHCPGICNAESTRNPLTVADFVDIDHRTLIVVGAGDLKAYLRAALSETPHNRIFVEAVHLLTELGAVVTHVASGTSHEGFDAEWRITDIFTVEGDLLSRCEIFDEADLDAALARFEELQPQTHRLENAATRADHRFFGYFAACDWAAIAEVLSDDSSMDDRRRVVNAGFWDGRDVVIANMRALAEAGAKTALTVIATRGDRLALIRMCSASRDLQHGEFDVEMLGVVEIDTEERIAAHVMFESDAIDAPSPSSTPATSRAKRPRTRTRGRVGGTTPRSTDANSPRRRRTGSTSTTAEGHRSHPAT